MARISGTKGSGMEKGTRKVINSKNVKTVINLGVLRR